MEKPFFSVVIPTYNRQELVPFAIQSVLLQTFDNYEIVVCDNFSTDKTAAVISQFKDHRIKYVRTPKHFVIADSFEFARKNASGHNVLMMSDDDALVNSALERFYKEYLKHNAQFIFSNMCEYRDSGFPGFERNIFDCPAFSGISRIILEDEFLNPLFSFNQKFSLHPSCFVFSSTLADSIANRTGRFFQTNGIEFFAWPVAAVLSNRIAYIDTPLVIIGRTKKSWGSNIVLCNPGKEKIKKMVDDVEQMPKFAPLTNFTWHNMVAEGILTAKNLYPKEFEKYKIDEAQYIIRTKDELERRKMLGVNVSKELDEIKRHLDNNPILMNDVYRREQMNGKKDNLNFWKRLRSKIGDLGARQLKENMLKSTRIRNITRANAHKIRNGEISNGLKISGEDFGFNDILGCAGLLRNLIEENSKKLNLN